MSLALRRGLREEMAAAAAPPPVLSEPRLEARLADVEDLLQVWHGTSPAGARQPRDRNTSRLYTRIPRAVVSGGP